MDVEMKFIVTYSLEEARAWDKLLMKHSPNSMSKLGIPEDEIVLLRNMYINPPELDEE